MTTEQIAVDLDGALAALDAAESILRYSADIATNVNGTRPNMSTRKALEMVRSVLRQAGRDYK
jgi:Cdc6-like AAA superfamily ATPase